jgi:hypothetical protein
MRFPSSLTRVSPARTRLAAMSLNPSRTPPRHAISSFSLEGDPACVAKERAVTQQPADCGGINVVGASDISLRLASGQRAGPVHAFRTRRNPSGGHSERGGHSHDTQAARQKPHAMQPLISFPRPGSGGSRMDLKTISSHWSDDIKPGSVWMMPGVLWVTSTSGFSSTNSAASSARRFRKIQAVLGCRRGSPSFRK